MTKQIRCCLLAGAMIVAAASTATAASQSANHSTGQRAEFQRGNYGNIGAPGPIAGAGLAFLLVAGAGYAFRRYRRRSQ